LEEMKTLDKLTQSYREKKITNIEINTSSNKLFQQA